MLRGVAYVLSCLLTAAAAAGSTFSVYVAIHYQNRTILFEQGVLCAAGTWVCLAFGIYGMIKYW